MEVQILDCDYIVVNNKPIVRIFGKTTEGKTVCVCHQNFLPYFYLYADEKKYPVIMRDIHDQYPNLVIETVERILPIGYQGPVKVLLHGYSVANGYYHSFQFRQCSGP